MTTVENQKLDKTLDDISKETVTSPKVKVLQWSPVAIWTHNVACDDFKCTICSKNTTGKCAECSDQYDITKQNCSIAKGNCGHGYHYHCINKWLSSGSQICPICRIPWNYKTQNIDNVTNGFKKRVQKNMSNKLSSAKK
jgi:RING-box protein 1